MNFLLQNSHRFCLLGDVGVFTVVGEVTTAVDVAVVGIDKDIGAVPIGAVTGCSSSAWVVGSCC